MAVESNYVPAMRQLASNALRNQDLESALKWCSMAVEKKDPLSSLTLASLLPSDETNANYIQELLRYAAQNHSIIVPEKKEKIVFKVPHAKEILNDFLSEKHKAYEEQLETVRSEELASLEMQAIDQKNISAGCFFMKKFVQGDKLLGIKKMPERTLDWAELLTQSQQFDPDYFNASGAYQALDTIADDQDPQLKSRAHFLLGSLKRRQMWENNDFSESSLVKQHLMQTTENPQASLMLAEFDEKQAVAHCKKAVVVLHKASAIEHPPLIRALVQKCKQLVQAQESGVLEVILQLCDTPEFERIKDPELAFGLGCDLLEMRGGVEETGKELKKQKQKMRNHAIRLFKSAYEKGNVIAGWYVLAHEQPHENSVAFLERVVHATGTADAKTNESATVVCQALEHLQTRSGDQSLYAQLGRIYLKDQFLAADEKKGFELLKKSGDKGLSVLIEHAQKMQNPEVCLDAGILLVENRKKIDRAQALAAGYAYLDRALENGDATLKERMIRECLNDSNILRSYAVAAMKIYCEDIAEQEEPAQKSLDFINEVFPIFIERADNGDVDSALLVHELLTEWPKVVTHAQLTDKAGLAHCYLDQTARSGDFDALCKQMQQYDNLAPDEIAYTNAARFWHLLYMISSICSAQDAPEIKTKAYAALVKLYDDKMAHDAIIINSPEFYYYLMMAFAQSDGQKAFNAFLKGERCVHVDMVNPDHVAMHTRLGVPQVLERCAQEGKGWALYALGLMHLNYFPLERIDISTAQDIHESIKNLEHVRSYMLQARIAKEPHTNLTGCDESNIDYFLGNHYQKLALLNSKEALVWSAKAMQYFDACGQQGNPKGLKEWAIGCLKGDGPKGQEAFEKAIKRLIQAAALKEQEAIDELAKISQKGFAYASQCGGAITAQMLESIKRIDEDNFNQTVQELGLPLNDAPVNNVPVASPVAIEQAIANFNNGAYQAAYDIFQQEAATDDVVANIYLGIMHRDGVLVEKSAARAREYFIDALLKGQTRQVNLPILKIAYEGLSGCSADDVRAHVARASYMVSVELHKRDPGKTPINVDEISSHLLQAEKAAWASSNDDDRRLIFSSGLSSLIVALYRKEKSIPLLVEVVSTYLQRVLHIGINTQRDQEQMVELVIPLMEFNQEIINNILDERARSCFLKNIGEKKVSLLLTSLKTIIAARQRDLFLSLLGLLHIEGTLEKLPWANIKMGEEYLGQASQLTNAAKEQTKSAKAAQLVLGFLYLNGHKLMDTIPYKPKRGVQLLQPLADQSSKSALMALGNHYRFAKKNDHAEVYFKKACELSQQNGEAAFGLIKIYENKPKKIIAQDYVWANNILQSMSAHPDLADIVPLHQAYCALLANNKSVFSDDAIMHMLEQVVLKTDRNPLIQKELSELCQHNQLPEIIDEWRTKNEANVQTKDERKSLTKALSLSEFIRRFAIFKLSKNLPDITKTIVKISVEMGKADLKMADVPLLKVLIDEVRNGVKKMSHAAPSFMSKDLAFFDIIEKKYG